MLAKESQTSPDQTLRPPIECLYRHSARKSLACHETTKTRLQPKSLQICLAGQNSAANPAVRQKKESLLIRKRHPTWIPCSGDQELTPAHAEASSYAGRV